MRPVSARSQVWAYPEHGDASALGGTDLEDDGRTFTPQVWLTYGGKRVLAGD